MFKSGDKVICVENRGLPYLTLNKTYTIARVGDSVVYLYNDIGILNFYSSERFKIDISDIRKQKLTKINQHERR